MLVSHFKVVLEAEGVDIIEAQFEFGDLKQNLYAR